MNKLAFGLFGGVWLALLIITSGCSGTPSEDTTSAPTPTNQPARTPANGQPAPSNTPAPSGNGGAPVDGQPGQGQDDLMKQRREFLTQKSLERARAAMTNRQWDVARAECASVLEMDPSNKEARDLLIQAETNLGQRVPSALQGHVDRVAQAEVEKERARLLAREHEQMGDVAREKQDYDGAIQEYTKAKYTIAYNPYFAAGSDDELRIEAKIKTTQEEKAKALEQRANEAERVAHARLEEEERAQRIARQTKVAKLLQEANLAFQRGRYEDTANLLKMALAEDHNNAGAQDLLALAQRARHEQNMDELARRWKTRWVDTFDDLHTGDLPQTDVVVHDLKHWESVVAERTPLEFSSEEEVDSPEDRDVMRLLEERSFVHHFDDAPVAEWAKWYQQTTGVNFLVSKKLSEVEAEQTTLRSFELPKMSVKQALNNISRIKKVKWRVHNGVVHLLAPDEGGGKSYLHFYEVNSLVAQVPNYPGRDINLRGHGEDEPAEPAIEPEPSVMEDTKLVDLIKENIAKESWDGTINAISYQKGTLVVRQTREVHTSIEKLLKDLRNSVGIQVQVEARFLRVEDNFLEDVGVDLRGLGNQASEGVPGRGLEKQGPRPGAGFDDYGRRENISPSSPGEIGTGTEPGIFYNDGNDGDLFARTEHLYDRTLGGGEGGLNNAGGLSLQYAYLDDTELQVVLRAVSKQERVEEITAPQLLLNNTQRGNLSVTNQISYIKDFEVEIAQAAAVADPVVGVVKDGIVLDVRPVVSADRRFITMELRPTVANLTLPIPTFTTTLGVGQPISIQLPQLRVQKVRTTVTIPDGGTLVLGGMKMTEKQNYDSGIPFLKDIPIINFLSSRKGTYIANKKIVILLRANIIIPEESEPTPPKIDDIAATRR